MGRTGIRRTSFWGKLFIFLLLLLVVAPVALLLIFRFLPVPATPQMLWSLAQGKGARYAWSDDLPLFLGKAVIGSEDQNFCNHRGFDWKSIDQAVAAHERHPARRLRGASTISQQTARTLFLVPVRSWIRKGMEAYLTVLIEALWPKKRILEAYLNLVDWGHGNFGAEAAARAYFHTNAAGLSRAEAARLAAILPDPDKWNAANPGPYVASRSELLVARAGEVTRDNLDFCLK
ncbi:MAG TPA: monofunctional biosynthetic peptidoglycan transglycosylase [Rhizomicrobium sp.]|jgi:monofunctional biosynthetic peptidoglycan transglycosylase|nr:monofunctional biosynthetic peptidoglycan transglycosylase [Rhizomicrobium sp.]